MADVTIPNKEEIAQLRRWAQLAFAARCARRVQPLFKHFWPDAPKKHVDAVDAAVRLAEHCASIGSLTDASADDAADAADDAAHAADDHAEAAGVAAFAAAHAATAAFADAAAFAGIATRNDYELLKTVASLAGWDDDTAVPPDVFGPMWPNGAPKGWPPSGQEEETAPVELVIDLEVPDDVEESHVIARLRELVGTMDQMHRGMGGGGLTVSGVKVHVDVEARARVPG